MLRMAVRVVLAAPTYAGPMANMGNCSPRPPAGTPEGQLSASYDWSVSQVQYMALQTDKFGAPPANSYTDSISPAQPSASSAATLTFTPLVTGYWQISTSCSVIVRVHKGCQPGAGGQPYPAIVNGASPDHNCDQGGV